MRGYDKVIRMAKHPAQLINESWYRGDIPIAFLLTQYGSGDIAIPIISFGQTACIARRYFPFCKCSVNNISPDSYIMISFICLLTCCYLYGCHISFNFSLGSITILTIFVIFVLENRKR